MSQYYRNNPDEKISHDWTAPGKPVKQLQRCACGSWQNLKLFMVRHLHGIHADEVRPVCPKCLVECARNFEFLDPATPPKTTQFDLPM
ncbi:MAG: hypothetical protein H0U18_16050 [Pyrinomonadaceae bacterium]|nr:hypothetical protein [Pyrinomonadaceae bacterium]